MHVFAHTPPVRNPSEQFTGDVWLDPIASPRDDGQRMIVAKVRFAPGARTAWHSHARGQTLRISVLAWSWPKKVSTARTAPRRSR